MKNFLSPPETLNAVIESGIYKANLKVLKQFILAMLAGAFIAFGAQGSNMAVHTIANANIGKFIAGLIFPAGLIMVVTAGAELFTGNSLMIIALAERKISFAKLLRSWIIVYAGNFLGSLLIALMICSSGLLEMTGGALREFTINTAVAKINLSFSQAFIRGILCNWLVCLAVWMSTGAKDGAGRILAIFFPIWLFVTSGFEHSIANMYYIPAGIFADSNEIISWTAMFMKNLIPVTIGNILGGVFFVGVIYWLVYRD